ncbi:MAG: tRNA (N6-threonylcarbamoyladenosine(37)-N6)-methyltransferase TrmO, partial [Clostridia bacterium]|nr:tRNA (N6-threonylcarbamoyladenosine(37)-N6)-methyltransferase TrmO [Clostridia bacterium]
MKHIARIKTDFPEKFGIPRQSGVVRSLTGKIIFEPEYRNPDALRGIEDFSHLWILWEFSEMNSEGWSPTVRPPRLGGNRRVGVFATRSPNRPNPIGLSVVKIERIAQEPSCGTVIYVSGADMLDGTPIYDIKPYIPYADCVPEAVGGFADEVKDYSLEVDFPKELLEKIPPEKRKALTEILSGDPRPQYH